VILAIGILASAFLETPTLQLKLGDAWDYRLEQTFVPSDLGDSPEDELVFGYEGNVRVSGKKTEGFDLETSSRLVRQKSGGEWLPPVKGTTNQIQTITVSSTGDRIFEPCRYDSPNEFRLARLLWFGTVSGADEKDWTVRWPAIMGGWIPALEATFKFAGRTDRLGRKCSLYNVRYMEGESNPILATGKLEIDEELGIPMAAEVSSPSVPLPGGEGAFRLKQKLEVTALRLKPRKPV
jgi:hypothetical protein